MPPKIIALLFGLCLTLSSTAALAAEPELSDYQSTPYWIAPRSIPMVLLILSKDQKMFRHAYSPGDHDGDGFLDIGFNPETRYLGYYDHESCYGYENGYFRRKGYAEKNVAAAAPGGLDAHIKVPENKYGVCRASSQWHGNWLNFMMTSRIDAIKKVLYGGTRQIDRKDETIVEHSYVPRNAIVWGYDVMADDMWSGKTGHLPYYNSEYYLGVPKPTSGRMHFFARYTDGFTKDSLTKPPLFHVVRNIPANKKNRDGTNFRVWNWTVLAEEYIPADTAFTGAGLKRGDYTNNIYNARVRVCEMIDGVDEPLTGPPKGESCKQYPGTGKYKPIGLLQQYGEKDKMYFGLMTGVAQQAAKRRGGVIRHHIGSMSKAVDSETGVLIDSGGYGNDTGNNADRRANVAKNNIIRTIDKLTITSWVSTGSRGEFIKDWTSFGNPMGEMLFEGVRYFGGLAAPANSGLKEATPAFYTASANDKYYAGAYLYSDANNVPQSSEEARDDLYPKSSRPLPMITKWYQDRPEELAASCSKPVILMISDIDNTFDGDDPGNISGIPPLPSLQDKSSAFPDFSPSSMNSYLKMITNHEGYNTAGKLYYYARDPNNPEARAVCAPRPVRSLADVVGLCPNEPSLEGTYSMAAVAYYAHTHDFSPNRKGEPIDIYTVGVTPALPALTFNVPGSGQAAGVRQQITMMPTAVMNRTRDHLLSFIGYAIEDWKTDDDGTPYNVRINVNYADESEVHIRWSDYEQDSTSIYEINLLTDSTTPVVGRNCGAVCREAAPVVIHSGPLKGYSAPAAADGNPKTISGAKKYYRFARQSGGGKMSIPGSYIKGLAITSMIFRTSTSAEIGLGYTITGTDNDYDGTYIDAASNYKNHDHYPHDPNGVGVASWEVNGSPAKAVNSSGAVRNDNWYKGVITQAQESQRVYSITRRETAHPGFYDKLFTPMGCEKASASASNTTQCGENARMRMRILQTRSFEFSPNPPDVEYLPTPLELAAKYGGFSDPRATGFPDENDKSTWAAIEGYDEKTQAPVYGSTPKNYFYVANLSSLSEKLGRAFEAIANSVSTGTANSASINTILGGGMTVKTQYHSVYEDPKDSSVTVKWLGNIYSLFVDRWGNLREDTDAPNADEGRMLDITKDEIIDIEHDRGTGEPVIWRYPDLFGNNTKPSRDQWHKLKSFEDIRDIWNPARWLIAQNDVLNPRTYSNAAKGAEGGRRIYSYFGAEDGKVRKSDGSEAWTPVALSDYLFEPGNASRERLQTLLRCSSGRSEVRQACARKLIEYTLGVDQEGFRNRTVNTAWFEGRRVWRMGDVMNSRPIIVGEAGANFHLLYGDQSYAEYKEKVAGRRNMVYFGSNDGILHAVNAGFYGSLKLGMASYFVKPVAGDRVGKTGIPYHDLGAEVWGYIPTSVLPHLKWLTEPDFDHAYTVDLTPTIVDVKIGKNTSGYKEGWRTVLVMGLRMGGRTINIGTDEKPEYSHSEFFALDITEPDEEPVLMWRYSTSELGLTINSPMVVRSGHNWYVVLPSGPTLDIEENGSLQPGGRGAYDGRSLQNARIIVLDAVTGKRVDAGQLVVPEERSFFSDTFMPRASSTYVDRSDSDNITWSNYVVYLGLSAEKNARDTGALYRLQMVSEIDGQPLAPGEWKLSPMFNPDRPITGAINATYDTLGNLWVVFGTGRMWGKDDAYPCGPDPNPGDECRANYTQYLYGIKEDLVRGNKSNPNLNGTLTFKPLTGELLDVSRFSVYTNGGICNPDSLPGDRTACGVDELGSYNAMANDLKSGKYLGYKRELNTWKVLGEFYHFGDNVFEMVITQPKIDGLGNGRSNTVFTSYVPSGDPCDPGGYSFLYVVDTYTGLPAPYMKGYDLKQMESGLTVQTEDGVTLELMQLTGIKDAGSGMASEASIQDAGSVTIYGNTSSNMAENEVPIPRGPGDDEDGGFSGANQALSWREVVDIGLPIQPEDLFKDLMNDSQP
ncbi:hypothetical protein C4J81_02765 [Deltaproteobacteria bacterium Smac51]|nr:hypothetical protein C4J81_02765 [Deltaproteobacteria bacterium Smac51]